MRKMIFAVLILLLTLPMAGQANNPTQENHRSEGIRKANGMHPLFAIKDSIEHSCKECHDTDRIQNHSTHFNDRTQVSCLTCHLGVEKLTPDMVGPDHRLKKEITAHLSRPLNTSCAQCHGLVHEKATPLSLDPLLLLTHPSAAMTRQTGALFSPQAIRQSGLNLQDKDLRTSPWDIHAERQVRCIDCHFSANNPRKAAILGDVSDEGKNLDHLRFDPRTLNTSDYLAAPSHQLVTAKCTSCHEPLLVHDQLPYQNRHFQALACQSCHIPESSAPVLRILDQTLRTPELLPRAEFYNMNPGKDETYNNTYVSIYRPAMGINIGGKFTPVNSLTEIYWVKKDGSRISDDIVSELFRDLYREKDPQFFATFDANHDGNFDSQELFIANEKQRQFIQAKLEKQTHSELQIVAEIKEFPLSHGVQNGPRVLRDCTACHSSQSRLASALQIPANLPWGAEIRKPAESVIERYVSGVNHREFYVLGMHSGNWADRLGLALVALTVLGIGLHGGIRYKNRALVQGSGHSRSRTQRVYMYSMYERLWHWVNGFGIIFLIVTGFEVHYGGVIQLFGFRASVFIHNVLAVVLVVNGFMSLFYHLASKEIRQYLPPISGFSQAAISQIRYYLVGIFKGENHPLQKTAQAKLNPLQQMTYLGLLNFLIPFQVFTGLLFWLAQYSSERMPFIDSLAKLASSNLAWIGPFHTLGSWMLLQFLLMHIYLTTTGHTLTSNIQAMIVGYEDCEVSDEAH